jgi:biotin-(acetyl-CoA carboxylase) ligase
MSALFTFKQIIKALANTSIPLVCVIVITLLTASCATVPTKQTKSTDTTANSLTTKEKSDNETTADILQEIECRTVQVTGSRFTRKICEYKEVWAAIDKENKKESDEFVRGITEQSGLIDPEGKGVGGPGGRINSAVSP